MSEPNFIILYVADAEASARFYTGFLGKPPVEASPHFAMFVLASGVAVGLWQRNDVQPVPLAEAGASELAFTVDGRAAVDAQYADWRERGLPIAQAPTAMDFGYTCVALDPDGHRLRVFAPSHG